MFPDFVTKLTSMWDQLLSTRVTAEGLFGQSLDDIQAKFELWKKQTEALRSIISRCDAKHKPCLHFASLQHWIYGDIVPNGIAFP
ncbi:uncharacterized protein AKAME5_000150600 [Lates japonicus]|uniref:Uncharacterized protein n=1 Tax=Lates japonicus TaxID=270547 RepID=A0AAD3M4L5_LATJO|nr:uncharacterized protein AKAME5_000150600 [Lates japonicus]